MAEEQKKIIISVGADTSEFSQGVDEAKKKLQDLGNTPVDKSIKTLKQDLKEATNEAQKIAKQFGTTSKEFAAAASRVANLRDEFQEFNATVQSFNPDNKLQGLVSLGKGAVGAIQGVAGAMAFLGVESESASATIAKLQGLMAFSDALNSIDDIKNSFKNFGTVIQSTNVFQSINNGLTTAAGAIMKAFGVSVDTTSTSFKFLKGAIAATGIGLLVVGIVALIQNFDKLKVALGFSTAAQEEFAKTTEEANKAATDSVAKVTQSVNEVRNAFKLAEQGVISKKEALKKYNDTLGEAFGKTNDLKTAEKLLNDKAEDYIQMTMLKAQATVFFQKAAEAAAKGITASQEDQTTWFDKTIASIKSYYGDYSGSVKGLVDAQQEGVNEVKKQSTDLSKALNDQGANLLRQATEIGNRSKIQTSDQAAIRKQEALDTVQHYDNLIKIAQANGKDTYQLEKLKWQAKLKTAEEGSSEYKAIQADIAAFEASHSRGLIEALKDERQKLKDLLESMGKMVTDANRNVASIQQDARTKELNEIEQSYQDQKKVVQKSTQDFIKDLKGRLEKHLITQEEFNNSSSQAKKKQGEVEVALLNEKNAKELEVEKNYNKIFRDFRNQYEETEYQRQRSKLIEDFDEKIKLAEGKDRELTDKLKSLKDKELNKLDTSETLRKETINKESTLIEVQTDNQINENDTPEQRLSKLKAVHDAEKDFKEAQFQEELAKLGSDQDAIRNLKAKHQKDVTDDERAYSESRKNIHKLEAEQKIAQMKVVGDATNTLADIVGKQTVAGKALGVATALINTYQGASEVIKAKSVLPEPFGTIAKVASVASIIATGIRQVKAITAVQVPVKGGGGGVSAPTVSTAPIINAAQTAAATSQVQDVRLTNPQDQVVRSYIVDKDLQDNQDRTSFLNRLQSI